MTTPHDMAVCIELMRRLALEFRGDDSGGERPEIRIGGLEGAPRSEVYVIWDAWGGLSQLTRSEIITDAYLEAFPDDVLDLYVAAGLLTGEPLPPARTWARFRDAGEPDADPEAERSEPSTDAD